MINAFPVPFLLDEHILYVHILFECCKLSKITLIIFRVKRVSDAHFADVQTKHAVNRAKGIVITLPIGAGLRDLDLM